MKREQSQDWIEYIADQVHKNYGRREIVVWGSYKVSDEIKETLMEKYGIDVGFCVDNDKSKINGSQVFPPDYIAGKPDKYYVIVPLAFHKKIKEQLILGGYKADIDYCYFCDCVLCQESDYYEDAHGNRIIGNYHGLKFAFTGFNSVIKIGKNVRFLETTFYLHNESKVVIGNDAQLEKNYFWMHHSSETVFGEDVYLEKNDIIVRDKARIEIGSKCKIARLWMKIDEQAEVKFKEDVGIFYNIENVTDWQIGKNAKVEIGNKGSFNGGGIICLYENAVLKIGKEFSINGNYRIVLSSNTSIFIGEDCMFSWDICMRSNDGHSIFDVTTGKNINSSYSISKSRKIIVGNHVWVGERVEILYNAYIGDGSIIGAMSLVKDKVPNNCIAVGIPVKVIRKNIAWCRQEGIEDIMVCGREYIQSTKEL